MNDLERFRSALSFISPDDRDTWVRMGMAIKSELGEEGFEIWDAWSRQSDSYVECDAMDVWRSINGTGGVTAGTLFHQAKTDGWRDDGTHPKPTPEELDERRRIAAERATKEEAKKAREREQARQNAEWILEVATATPAQANHPYLLRKRVSPVPSLLEIHASRVKEVIGYLPKCGDKTLEGRLLVVPIYVAGKLSTVELIDEAGLKSVLTGGQKSGGHWPAQDLPEGDGAGLTLLIGEGVATVLSCREATGHPAIAVLTCGNLLAVAREMRQRYPKAKLVALADLVKATGETDPHAIEAARAVGGLMAVPDFGENRPEGTTDFNDMHQIRGLNEVGECIAAQVAAQGDENEGARRDMAGAKASDIEGTASKAEDLDATVSRLAALPPIEYDRVRQVEAEALKVRVMTLDTEVEKERSKLSGDGNDGQGEAVLFPDIEPWAKPVDGAALLTDLAATCLVYSVLPKHADAALALWIVFTHCVDAVSVAPILALTSPERRCGKSTVIDLLSRLARRSLPASSISPAAVFRSLEAWAPTLLIDEADTFIRDSDELRGILNSGHTRGSAFVIRTVGDDHEPRKFSTWGAKTIALIGGLKDTLADRSIEIPLKRKLPRERTERLRHADPEAFHNLARRCVRWAADNDKAIRAARPSMPDGLHDRAQDNWEPLMAIADLAGGGWRKLAREAALALSGDKDIENDNIRVQLLRDIRVVFKGSDRISSEDLTTRLVAMEERPWSEYSRGKPLTKAKLARLLRPFKVVSGSKRLPDGTTPKGYLLNQFTDAFKRYLPPPEDPPSPGDPPFKTPHRHKQGVARVSEDSENATAGEYGVSENGPKPRCGAGCGGVADSTPPSWGTRL